MRKLIAKFAKFVKRGRLVAAGVIIVAGMCTSGAATFIQPQPAMARYMPDDPDDNIGAGSPTVTTPKPTVNCALDKAVGTQTSTTVAYTFTATIMYTSTSITSATINVGDGSATQNIKSFSKLRTNDPSMSAVTATLHYTYTKRSTPRTVVAQVTSVGANSGPAVIANSCKTASFTIPGTASTTPVKQTTPTAPTTPKVHTTTPITTKPTIHTATKTTTPTTTTTTSQTPTTASAPQTLSAQTTRQAELVNVGPGDTLKTAVITTVLGFLVYQLVLRRKLSTL